MLPIQADSGQILGKIINFIVAPRCQLVSFGIYQPPVPVKANPGPPFGKYPDIVIARLYPLFTGQINKPPFALPADTGPSLKKAHTVVIAAAQFPSPAIDKHVLPIFQYRNSAPGKRLQWFLGIAQVRKHCTGGINNSPVAAKLDPGRPGRKSLCCFVAAGNTDRPRSVNIAPTITGLDRCETLGKGFSFYKARCHDILAPAIDIAPFAILQHRRGAFAKRPDSGKHTG